MDILLDFIDAVNATQTPVRLWVWWMVGVLTVVPLVLLLRAETRRMALVLILVGAATTAAMLALYARVGFVRLLGLPHVVLWTPLLIWLLRRLILGSVPAGWPRLVLLVLAATMATSLVIDYGDVIRYLAGERAPTI